MSAKYIFFFNVMFVYADIRKGYFLQHRGQKAPPYIKCVKEIGLFANPVIDNGVLAGHIISKTSFSISSYDHDKIGKELGYPCKHPKSYGNFGETFINFEVKLNKRWTQLYGYWCDSSYKTAVKDAEKTLEKMRKLFPEKEFRIN